jgi:hypothetical protein
MAFQRRRGLMNKLSFMTYIVASSVFFVVSLKISGAEAYHQTGFAAYFKWAILSLVLNVGFLIQFLKPIGWKKVVAIFFMLFALTMNVMIYTNPKSWVLYDLLSISLLFISVYLVIKGAFGNGKNLYA